jgi:hypothetical protein
MRPHLALFLATMVVGSSVPLSLQALYRYDGMELHSAPGETVTVQARYGAAERIDLRKALNIYQTLLDMGETGLVRPTLSKPDTIRLYLDAYPDGLRYEKKVEKNPVAPTDYVAPVAVPSSREASELDRAEYRRAVRTGTCFVSLPTGLRELCESLTKGKKPSNLRGLENDLIKGRQQHKVQLRQEAAE